MRSTHGPTEAEMFANIVRANKEDEIATRRLDAPAAQARSPRHSIKLAI